VRCSPAVAVLAAAATVAGLLVAPAASAAPLPRSTTSSTEARRVDRVPAPRLAWRRCGDFFTPGAQCTTAELPLDYDDPDGATTTVALLKLPAQDPARRIGSLFVNPGGPGGSGVELADVAPLFLDQRVLDRFDVVGFDPRGTNLSDGVRCWPDADAQSADLAGLRPAFPAGIRQIRAAVASSQVFGRRCARAGRPLGASMSTAQVARDMDVLRRAVGDEQLTYLGFSYGSYLGQVYANLFPDRVRALVLDGVIDPVAWAGTRATRGVPQTTRLGSGRSSAAALRELLKRCRAAGPVYCSLAGQGDPSVVHQRVLRRLKQAPLVIGDPTYPQTWSYADTVGTLVDLLYSPWAGDDVDAFLTYLDDLLGPAPTRAETRTAAKGLHRIRLARKAARALGTPSRAHRKAFRRLETPFYSNAPEAFQSVLCTDGLNPPRAERWRGYAVSANRMTGGFGRLWAWSSAPCASSTWTTRDEDVYRGPFTARTAHPVLVVGSTWDPATPYAGAVAAASLLPDSRLLSSDNWGHTAYGTSRCVDRAVTRYLVSGTLPPQGTRCTGDVQPYTVPLADGAGLLAKGTAATRRPSRAPARPRSPIAGLRP
jgi:pimeloyl-ACP methyl ester carboxylesterase